MIAQGLAKPAPAKCSRSAWRNSNRAAESWAASMNKRDAIERERLFHGQMPNNFAYVGFIKAILPNAKIIDARRHPMDSCFGCFKQHFAKGQTFTYDLFELGSFISNTSD